MESLKKIIRDVLRESVIEETQTGQKDLEKFANDILKFMGQRCIDEYESQMKYDVDNTQIYRFPIVHTGKMEGDGYGEIGEFVKETSIKIFPVTWIDREGTKGRLSYAAPEKNNGREYFEIKLKYQGNNVEDINEILRSKYPDVTATDIYFKLFYIFYSTLLHELQHAYDAWRSKGKAFDSQLNPNYQKQQDYAHALELKKKEDLTPEEIEAMGNSYKDYLNLVHEINARYAQAMHKVRAVTFDDEFNDVMKPWDGVFREFKLYFDGWRFLSDKMKKKLIRRVAKAYQEESENLKTAEEKYSKKDLEMVQESGDLTEGLEYRTEHMGSHHGQEDFELGLYMDDEIIGMVQYTLYDGELTIRDIIVRPEFRRQGYGSKMMKYIKEKHPEHQYTPSMKTDLGAKFVHKDVDLNEVRRMVRQVLREVENPDEYRGVHVMRKDSTSSPLHNLLQSGQVAPDFYENIHHYAYLHNKSDKESVNIIRQVKGRPEATVIIYRAVPKGVTEINPGDWVSLSKSYAIHHGLHHEDSKLDKPVISKKVKAKDVWWDGNDVNEFSYFPGEVSESISEEREVDGINEKTKLSVFDFDSTLVNTPTPETGTQEWEQKTGMPWEGRWWDNPESLNTDVFEMPVNQSVISAYKKERSNPNNLVIMMTGRNPKLSKQVEKILDMNGLEFDDYVYNSGTETSGNKMLKMELALKYNPNIREVEMFDDRDEHIPIFQKWGDAMIEQGYLDEFKINHLK
jgi:GNAT superfamily N-acetyltransferase